MDAEQIRGLRPQLAGFLKRFDDCFARKDTRAHLSIYVGGQLSDLDRKSVEPIALAAEVPVRTLQEFISQHRWQEDLARDRLQDIVATEHAHPHSVGIIDETSFVKQGKKTPGVQRQYLGTVGKKQNGIVTVHLAYAADDFHCLLDGELFLPESWAADPARCQEAKIPAGMTYRPKTEIALELYDRAGQRHPFRLVDVRRVVWRKTRVFAGIGPASTALRGRGAADLDGLDRPAAGHPAAVASWSWTWSQGAADRGQQSAIATCRTSVLVAPGAEGTRMATLARQGWRERSDDLGSQACAVLPARPGWSARAALAFGNRTQRTRSHGDEVLRQQRIAGHFRGHNPPGSLLALACGKVFRRW